MVLSRPEIRRLYRRTARFYDPALRVYRALGVRRLRRRAVQKLHLRPGDTVVDMGCGTGLNFELLVEAVGDAGRVVGVDLTDAMLDHAAARIERNGWRNVDLVEADLARYVFPDAMNAAIGTFALEMIPEYPEIVRRLHEALPPDGSVALVGMKHPEAWPAWLVDLGILLNRPFGVSREYASFRPWESVRECFDEVTFEESYFGAVYTCTGRGGPP